MVTKEEINSWKTKREIMNYSMEAHCKKEKNCHKFQIKKFKKRKK